MFGIIGKIRCVDGKRDELVSILLNGTVNMPGNLLYVVSKDNEAENAIWIHEVWENKAAHEESLKLPQVQSAITKGRPLISDFETSVQITPVGGNGL